MSRKKTEMNPIRAERVKTLIEREKHLHDPKFSQVKLADKIHMTQQNISRIVQMKQPLTEETARLIIEAFPDYRIEWLLGYDNDMTENEKYLNKLDKAKSRSELLHDAIHSFLQLSGFDIKDTYHFSLHGDVDENEAYNRIMDAGYIISRDGKSVSMSLEDFTNFAKEINDYVAFRLNHIMK